MRVTFHDVKMLLLAHGLENERQVSKDGHLLDISSLFFPFYLCAYVCPDCKVRALSKMEQEIASRANDGFLKIKEKQNLHTDASLSLCNYHLFSHSNNSLHSFDDKVAELPQS